MLQFAAAFLSSLSAMPGFLLALALAPRLTGRLVIILSVIDLWLLLEVLEALARPAYVFGSGSLPRLAASAAQVALAIAIFSAWQRLETTEKASVPAPLPQKPALRKRPIHSRAFPIPGAEAG